MIDIKRATQDADCAMVEELVQWIPCRGGAISPLVTRGLFARHQVSVVFPRHSAIAWWPRKVLDR